MTGHVITHDRDDAVATFPLALLRAFVRAVPNSEPDLNAQLRRSGISPALLDDGLRSTLCERLLSADQRGLSGGSSGHQRQDDLTVAPGSTWLVVAAGAARPAVSRS